MNPFDVIAVVCALAVGVLIGFFIRKKIAEASIKSAEDEAKRIVDEALKTGETKKKEMLI